MLLREEIFSFEPQSFQNNVETSPEIIDTLNDQMSQIYFRFLRVAHEIEMQNISVKNLDSTALMLLNEIAVQHFVGKTLTVSQAMALKKLASPITIHNKLCELREAGLIDQLFEGKNRRTKFLKPTKIADSYFGMMSKAITSAVNS